MELSAVDIQTIYFDPEALRLPTYRLGRVAQGRGRLYFRYNKESDTLDLFNSLTTVLSQCSPTPWPLTEWFAKHGIKEAQRLSDTAAMYGTLMHESIGEFCVNHVFNYDKAQERVDEYLSKHSFWQPECETWGWKLRQDMAAWAQFVHDTQMKVMAVEICLASEKAVATACDVVCTLSLPVKGFHGEVYAASNKEMVGKPKETVKKIKKTALINMKSGRHGFYESNGLQLEAERMIFQENFPSIKIDVILNWAPSDYENPDSDKYKIKDWTGITDPKELDAMFMLAECRFKDKLKEKEFMSIHGETLYGNSPVSNISRSKLKEWLLNRERKKYLPE
jgi:hypothetical protein